jgi:lysophospholipase
VDSVLSPPAGAPAQPGAPGSPAAAGIPGSGVDESRGFVDLPGNPPPENAEIIWYESRGKKLRLLFAAEPKGGVKTRGTVWVCPGRTEFIEKYFEVARDLQKRGFALAIFDWPGQGLSPRLLKDPMKGHIRTFGQYVDAFRRGVEKVGRKAPKPHLILAHSMGGAIALEAMRLRQVEVEAAAFSAPMWGLKIWFVQRWLARLARFVGLGARPAQPPQPEETFATTQLTHDEKRWRVQRDLIALEPRLDLGGPTIAWGVASLNVSRGFEQPAALDHLRKTPMLIASAPQEALVSNAAQKKIAKRLKHARLISIDGARHEILMESDESREQFWRAFDELCRRAGI